MAKESHDIYQLVWWTRRLFQQLRATSEELLAGTDINPSHRALLEFLYDQSPQTVSHIARERTVSRQHIQTVVNDLLALGLVETRDNPAHKRSPLIALTEAGKKLFQKITRKEAKLLEALAGEFDQRAIANSTETLKTIHDYLQSGGWKK